MWPTQGVAGTPTPRRWSERRLRSRVLAIVGIAVLLIAAGIGTWLSIHGGQPATPPLYGTARSSPGAVWTWDGMRYTLNSAAAEGPSSNNADMAYDRSRGVTVLWDHGCASLVMGFQGGCLAQVDRTWTWDGTSWTAYPRQSNPTAAGPGAMVFDRRLGQVVYVNGTGRAWHWTGSGWLSLSMPGGPNVPEPGSGIASSAFAAGYDEGRDLLVVVVSGGTWSWDGSRWTEVPGGIAVGNAREDAHLVYDRANRQLVYVGSSATWTWDGSRWQRHDQPAIAAGTAAYDGARATTMLIQPDTTVCDRTSCRTTTWTWNARTWTQVPVGSGPLLPLTRSGAFPIPMAFDEARGEMVMFVSSS
jgi:hypothetical protein